MVLRLNMIILGAAVSVIAVRVDGACPQQLGEGAVPIRNGSKYYYKPGFPFLKEVAESANNLLEVCRSFSELEPIALRHKEDFLSLQLFIRDSIKQNETFAKYVKANSAVFYTAIGQYFGSQLGREWVNHVKDKDGKFEPDFFYEQKKPPYLIWNTWPKNKRADHVEPEECHYAPIGVMGDNETNITEYYMVLNCAHSVNHRWMYIWACQIKPTHTCFYETNEERKYAARKEKLVPNLFVEIGSTSNNYWKMSTEPLTYEEATENIASAETDCPSNDGDFERWKGYNSGGMERDYMQVDYPTMERHQLAFLIHNHFKSIDVYSHAAWWGGPATGNKPNRVHFVHPFYNITNGDSSRNVKPIIGPHEFSIPPDYNRYFVLCHIKMPMHCLCKGDENCDE